MSNHLCHLLIIFVVCGIIALMVIVKIICIRCWILVRRIHLLRLNTTWLSKIRIKLFFCWINFRFLFLITFTFGLRSSTIFTFTTTPSSLSSGSRFGVFFFIQSYWFTLLTMELYLFTYFCRLRTTYQFLIFLNLLRLYLIYKTKHICIEFFVSYIVMISF